MKGFKEKQELIEAQRKGMPLQEIFLRLFFSNFLLHQEIFFYQKEIFVLKEQISKDRQEHFETTLSASEEKELEVSFVFSKCCLSQLNTITEEVIEELNSYLLSFLILDHLKSLNKETALALSLFKGEYLSLNSLQSLNPQILQEICQLGKSSVFIPKFSRTFFKLVLNSIAEVNEEIVEIFSHECFIKNLYLGGITSFRDSVLKRLCESPRIKKLSLNGLQKLDENQAEILSQFKGIGLELDGLKTLEIKVAQKLFQFQEIFSFISLNGLGELEEGVAEALSLWTPTPPLRPLPFLSKISLSGLNVLQRKELEALSCWKGFSLCFNGLKELKSDILPFFSQLEVEQLQLKGLEYLELETVSRLNFSKINLRILNLDGLKELEPKVLEKVMNSNIDTLYLNGVKKLSPKLAEAFALFLKKRTAHNSFCLYLNGIEELEQESAKIVRQWSVNRLHLGLKELKAEIAEILSQWKGKGTFNILYLDKLEHLEPEIAQILFQSSDSESTSSSDACIKLNELRVLDEKLARILIQSERSCSLEGLKYLETEVKKMFGASQKDISFSKEMKKQIDVYYVEDKEEKKKQKERIRIMCEEREETHKRFEATLTEEEKKVWEDEISPISKTLFQTFESSSQESMLSEIRAKLAEKNTSPHSNPTSGENG